MGFYHRSAVKQAASSTLVVDSFTTDEKTGLVSCKSVSAEGPLPTMDIYNYNKMLKAGVDLRQVNTTILGSVNLPEVPDDKPEDKPEDESKDNYEDKV